MNGKLPASANGAAVAATAVASVASILERLAETERRQVEDRSRQIADQSRNEERFDTIFKAMDGSKCCHCESVASSQFQFPMEVAA